MSYRELMFKCKKCGFEEEVPYFVAFEGYTPEEFDKKKKMVYYVSIYQGGESCLLETSRN